MRKPAKPTQTDRKNRPTKPTTREVDGKALEQVSGGTGRDNIVWAT